MATPMECNDNHCKRLHGLTEYAFSKYSSSNSSKSKDYMHLCFYIPTKDCWSNIVAYGENTTRRCIGNRPSTHAEIDGLRKMRIQQSINPKIARSTFDIVVIRFSKTGKLGISRPCYHCLKSLNESDINIKYVYYSTGNGNEIVRETLNEMMNDDMAHISSGWRQRMGINHKDYCTHIIKQKLECEQESDKETNYAKQVFKEYLLKQYKKSLHTS